MFCIGALSAGAVPSNPFNRTWVLLQENTAPAAGVNQYQRLDLLVGSLIQGALSILGLLFFVYVVYGGYLWMTARGNTDQVEKAKEVLIHGTIGLVIVLAAYAIAAFVIGRLEDTTTGIFTQQGP